MKRSKISNFFYLLGVLISLLLFCYWTYGCSSMNNKYIDESAFEQRIFLSAENDRYLDTYNNIICLNKEDHYKFIYLDFEDNVMNIHCDLGDETIYYLLIIDEDNLYSYQYNCYLRSK